MSTSRRVHLWLPAELESELAAFARQRGLGLGPAIRVLLAHALTSGPDDVKSTDSGAAVAALVAAEHAVLMVASILPEGEQRIRSLAQRATQAAEERLAYLGQSAPTGDER